MGGMEKWKEGREEGKEGWREGGEGGKEGKGEKNEEGFMSTSVKVTPFSSSHLPSLSQ